MGTGDIALNVPVSGSGGFNYTQGTYLEGFEFTANRAISVTALGAYDLNLSSLTTEPSNSSRSRSPCTTSRRTPSSPSSP